MGFCIWRGVVSLIFFFCSLSFSSFILLRFPPDFLFIFRTRLTRHLVRISGAARALEFFRMKSPSSSSIKSVRMGMGLFTGLLAKMLLSPKHWGTGMEQKGHKDWIETPPFFFYYRFLRPAYLPIVYVHYFLPFLFDYRRMAVLRNESLV